MSSSDHQMPPNNSSQQDEIHWLRLSIPFREYQNILQPSLVATTTTVGRSHIKIPSTSSHAPYSEDTSNPHPHPIANTDTNPLSSNIVGPSPTISTIPEISTTVITSSDTPISTPLPTTKSVYTTPIKNSHTTSSISKNMRQPSMDSTIVPLFDQNINTNNTTSKLAITLPSISAAAIDSTRPNLRYAYISSPTSPTNTMSEVAIEMESLDSSNHHLRSPSGLSPSLNPSSPYSSCSCPNQSCVIHTQPLSNQSVPRMVMMTLGTKKGRRTPSFGSRRVCPVLSEDIDDDHQDNNNNNKNNNNISRSPISDMKTISELEGLDKPEKSDYVEKSTQNSTTCPLPKNNIHPSSPIRQPRRSSIFAGRGTYIDVEHSMMQFPIRIYRPLIGKHQWNHFMFSLLGRKRFLVCASVIVICAVVSMTLFDSMSLFSLYFAAVTFSILFVFCLLIIFHWFDFLLMWEVVCRWDSILCFAYLLISAIMSIWKSTFDPTIARHLRISVSIITNLAATASYVLVLFSDAVPRSIFPRWTQMCMYFICSIAEAIVWLQVGILQDSFSIRNEPEVCLYGCMTLSRLHSIAAANLALASFKFFFSLLLWPKAAVIIKARTHLEN